MNDQKFSKIDFNLNLFNGFCDGYKTSLIPDIVANIRKFKAPVINEIAKRFEDMRHRILDALDGEGVDIAEWPIDLINKYFSLMDKAKAINDVLEKAADAADALDEMEASAHELQRL